MKAVSPDKAVFVNKAGDEVATVALVPLTPLVIIRALLLNGLGSLAYGYLYFSSPIGYG